MCRGVSVRQCSAALSRDQRGCVQRAAGAALAQEVSESSGLKSSLRGGREGMQGATFASTCTSTTCTSGTCTLGAHEQAATDRPPPHCACTQADKAASTRGPMSRGAHPSPTPPPTFNPRTPGLAVEPPEHPPPHPPPPPAPTPPTLNPRYTRPLSKSCLKTHHTLSMKEGSSVL